MARYTKLFRDNLDGFELSKGGRQCLAYCPFHDDKGSKHKGFTANLEDGTWYCFSCLEGGNAHEFIRRMNIDGFKEEVHYDRLEEIREELSDKIEEEDYGEMKWPESFKFVTGKNEGILRGKGLDYLTSVRGMNIKQVMKYRIGFCISGKYAMRVIVPVLEDGKLVYFVARSIAKRPKVPYKNPSQKEALKGKGKALFNYESAKDKSNIVVCEGVFDAISVGPHAVAVLGKTLSKRQVRLLRESKAKSITIAFDGDARSRAIDASQNLIGFGKEIKVADMPEGEDPDSLDRVELAKRIKNAKAVTFKDVVESILST